MPNQDNSYRYPEDLLVGADRPRQLPLALRARLEEALTDQRSRPLSPEVRGRLESTLRPQGPRRKWTVMAPGLAAAAAIVVVAALVVPGLVHKSPSTPVNNVALPAQHPSAVPRAAVRATVPSFARSGGTGAITTQHTPSGLKAARAGSQPVVVAPGVGALQPRSGPATGGTWVVVTGKGLGGVTEVHFGNVLAPRVEVVSPDEVRALSPVHAPGTVDVVVSGQIRRSPVSPADHYTYAP